MPRLSRVADDEPGTATLHVSIEADGVTVDVILDTGGSGTRLPPHVGAREDAHGTAHGALGASFVSARAVVRELRVGDTVHRDVTVESADAPPLLGLDVLARHRLDLVMSADCVMLDQENEADRWRPLPLSSHEHPHVELGWDDGTRATAVWDTGASLTVVDTLFAAAHPAAFIPMGMDTSGTDASGVTAETPLLSMAPCTIGGRRFTHTIAVAAPIRGIQPDGDPAFDLILGYPVIAQADWVIDFRNARWGYRSPASR